MADVEITLSPAEMSVVLAGLSEFVQLGTGDATEVAVRLIERLERAEHDHQVASNSSATNTKASNSTAKEYPQSDARPSTQPEGG